MYPEMHWGAVVDDDVDAAGAVEDVVDVAVPAAVCSHGPPSEVAAVQAEFVPDTA